MIKEVYTRKDHYSKCVKMRIEKISDGIARFGRKNEALYLLMYTVYVLGRL